MINLSPLDFINSLRETDKYIKDIYTQGSCYKFSKLLVYIFDGESYINKSSTHVVTKINNTYYDINGINESEKFFKLTKEQVEMCEKWSFGDKNGITVECPNCEEPIFIK